MMPFSAQEDRSKLPSDVSKSLQKLIEIACAQCHGPCSRLRTLSSSSSPDDRSLYSDLDREQVIKLEIQSRALMMKAKKIQPKDRLVFSGRPAWATSPAPGRVHGASTEKADDGEEERGEIEDAETESEAFFTVKSCFSYCSSAGRPSKFEFSGSSVLERFRHCQGWPFGLYHRALVLPPLPSSPADSWMWHKSNPVSGRYN